MAEDKLGNWGYNIIYNPIVIGVISPKLYLDPGAHLVGGEKVLWYEMS